jgi:hypothetical protein
MTNTSSINGLSANFIHSMLADQLATGSLTKPKNSNGSGDSPFSKMLSEATSGSSASTVGSSANASQLLSQLVSNYRSAGVQNQGQSLDPMTIAA